MPELPAGAPTGHTRVRRAASRLPGGSGDSADGFPGLPGWGEKAAAATFGRFPHLEDVPRDWRRWNPSIRGPMRSAATLFERWDEALLYRTLATLRADAPTIADVDELRWTGPAREFETWSRTMYARAAAAVS